MNYAWIITKDYIADPNYPEGSYCNAKGLMGPSELSAELQQRLEKGEGFRFRMYDDDGEKYYDGRIVFDDPEITEVVLTPGGEHFKPGTMLVTSNFPEEAFGPLWDFGTGNAGATSIKYFDSQNRLGVL